MSVAGLAQFLTPHLARSAPEAAKVVPFLLALGFVVYVGSIIAPFYLIRRARGLKPEDS
jgi:drug/metabolite transporter (DMT)-like permease